MSTAAHETSERYVAAIRALELPAELRARSGFWIAIYAAKPFALIVLGALAFAALPLWAGLPLGALTLLAAQRHFQTLVHDASHLFFHPSQSTNDWMANWFAAGWIGMEVNGYRKVHLQHHRHNGSADDPEHVSFATVRAAGGLGPMILRYVLGLESLRLVRKYFFQPAARDAGAVGRKPAGAAAKLRKLAPIAACQVLLLGFFALAGVWEAYPVWLYLAVTWNPLLSRLRFLAEHPGEGEATVTTLSSVLENAFFAPQSFNYHCEHHGWPMVPPYRLGQVHRWLSEEAHFYDTRPDLLSSSFVGKLIERESESASEANDAREPAT